MSPTLVEPELLEVVPYVDAKSLRAGDVILFRPLGQTSYLVHRVIRITPLGVVTRGDHNGSDDPWRLRFAEIAGRVAFAQIGKRRHTIQGGWIGLTFHYIFQAWLGIDRWSGKALHLPYRALADTGIVQRLVPRRWHPRVVVFQETRLLMLGSHIVGRRDPRGGGWQIKRPFRLLCNEGVLNKDSSELGNPSRETGLWH